MGTIYYFLEKNQTYLISIRIQPSISVRKTKKYTTYISKDYLLWRIVLIDFKELKIQKGQTEITEQKAATIFLDVAFLPVRSVNAMCFFEIKQTYWGTS